MTVLVLLVARYREAAKASSVEVEVPPGATLADVWSQLRVRIPGLSRDERPLFSCDRVYAREDRAIAGDEEIAVFPPVSGG